jgi:phosphatidylglycerophosphatase A
MDRVIASWFGTGLILGKLRGDDIGSGTVGALFTFPIAYWTGREYGWVGLAAVTVVVIGLSVWSTGRLSSTEGDAGWIVVDEAAGTMLAIVGLSLGPALVAFVVFRLADIFKTRFPGVSTAEQISGGWGITADDLVAGVYGLTAGHLVQALL